MKCPIKPKFIIVSSKSSIKPLSQAITSAFKLFYRQKESYRNKCRFFKDFNTFCVVQSDKQALKTINKLNARDAGMSINTIDVSTLHTKLPHIELRTVLYKLKDVCFEGRKNNFILLNYFGARWEKAKIKSQLCFCKQDIRGAVNYIMLGKNSVKVLV